MCITWKELFAIVMAVHTWGTQWASKNNFHCNNLGVVDIWQKDAIQNQHTMAYVGAASVF